MSVIVGLKWNERLTGGVRGASRAFRAARAIPSHGLWTVVIGLTTSDDIPFLLPHLRSKPSNTSAHRLLSLSLSLPPSLCYTFPVPSHDPLLSPGGSPLSSALEPGISPSCAFPPSPPALS